MNRRKKQLETKKPDPILMISVIQKVLRYLSFLL